MTYVSQAGGQPEKDLKEGLAQENKVISIVGESKTGKTTLCDNVFGKRLGIDKILVTGDRIESEHSLWSEAFRQLQTPVTSGYANNTVGETIDLLIHKGLPVILDDFHYVMKPVQQIICRQMKNAASRGLRFVVLNTPHRVDDPIRSNPDMSGRFFEVNLGFWTEPDLMQIGSKGFGKLGLRVADDVLRVLAREALRSPQLMQTLCLETCRVLPADTPFEHQEVTLANFDLQKVKEKAVRSYNYSTPLDFLRNGPEERGSPRNIYKLVDGSEGDVYEVLIRALAIDPPFLTISLDHLKDRVAGLVGPEGKQPNVQMALGYTPTLFKDSGTQQKAAHGRRSALLLLFALQGQIAAVCQHATAGASTSVRPLALEQFLASRSTLECPAPAAARPPLGLPSLSTPLPSCRTAVLKPPHSRRFAIV